MNASLDIAIIGMAGRFPGASTLADYWRLLAEGREGIVQFDESWLRAQGVDEATLADPAYVKAGAPIDGADLFDAAFFGIAAREAELMDPQHRLFLECAWSALESAGHDAQRHAGAIGVFGGAGMNGYLLNVYGHAATRASTSPYEIFLGNDKDFLATRVAYKLGLRGPALAVQTACSSSLVAVHLACQSLLAGECDMALAGGVALSRQLGYRAQQGGIHASDGHCRAFAAAASGTVPGNGVGVIVLRRLEEALAAGDHVLAVIKGSAINNDGAHKQSFTAPSLERQAAVIEAALAAADVDARSIGCVEAHGTGTRLGDPVEVAALVRAFGGDGHPGSAWCALGSVKSNIGHLDAAAGIAGLMKMVLALQHRQIPPTLHAQQANPAIDFAASPFRLATALADWPAAPGQPRRAGVSSFGIGGTNAHVVLEEAPEQVRAETIAQAASPLSTATTSPIGAPQLLLLSARSSAALAQASQELSAHLTAHPEQPLAAVAHTLREGRRAFGQRRAVLARSHAEAAALFATPEATDERAGAATRVSPVWLFSGQGTQRAGMARGLYAEQPAYRAAIDECAALLDTRLTRPLAELLCSADAETLLERTEWAQPALFAHGWALACWLRHMGLQPQAMAGHSLGEWVAACVAGVFELPTALALVTARGRRMQAMPAGAMLAVGASPQTLAPWLATESALSLAAVNAPQSCVVAGSFDAVARFELELQAQGVTSQRLRTSHAFHSPMMDAAARAFGDDVATLLEQAPAQPPRIPFVSGVSGTWIGADEATDPAYWARQLRGSVRFADAVTTLQTLPSPLFLELGAGRVLTGLVHQQSGLAEAGAPLRAIALQPDPADAQAQSAALLSALGRLWCAGLAPDWQRLPHGLARRVPLPTTPFERQRFWIDADALGTAPMGGGTGAGTGARTDAGSGSDALDIQSTAGTQTAPVPTARPLDDWFSVPGWRRLPPSASNAARRPQTWLLLDDGHGLADLLAQRLEAAGDQAFSVGHAASFAQTGFRAFVLNALERTQWQALRAALAERSLLPGGIVDLRALGHRDSTAAAPANAHAGVANDFTATASDTAGADTAIAQLLALAQAFADTAEPLQMLLVTRNACEVQGGDVPDPAQAALHGLALVPPQEHPLLGLCVIDIDKGLMGKPLAAMLCDALHEPDPSALVAWRGRHRWAFEPAAVSLPMPPAAQARPRSAGGARRGGRYLIVGDLERGLGTLWAQRLAALGAKELLLLSAALPATPVPAALVEACQAQGAEVRVLQAAPDDAQAVAAALQAVGDITIDGVFVSLPTTHADIAAPISMQEHTHWSHNRRSRLALLDALAPWVAQHAPAFCCVQSSMSSLLGGAGLGAYAAASQALDAWVQRASLAAPGAASARARSTRWIAIQWDPVAVHGSAAPLPHGLGSALQAHTLDADEAWAATQRVLASGLTGTVAVSRQPLAARRTQWLRPVPTRATENDAPGLMPQRAAHPRPPLATAYEAPHTDTEHHIAEMWQTLLRLDSVGIHDSFFDLGGHSLLAIQAIGRMRERFAVKLELRDLLDGTPTVAGIAAYIDSLRAPADAHSAARLAALLAEVSALSPDEVQAQLARPA